jgi:hypothetical protein
LAFAIVAVALGMPFLIPLMYELELARKLRQIVERSLVRGGRTGDATPAIE